MVVEKSGFHFSTIRKNIFLWDEECHRLITLKQHLSLDRANRGAYRLPVPNTSLAEIDSLKTEHKLIARAARGRWFFVGMALVFIATSIAGFLPAIVQPATRRAPLTLLAEAHGIVFFAWLLLYLAQSLLVANGRVDLHRRLGLTSIVLLAVMIPLGFTTTTAMVRRGFDLSGDQHVDPHPDGQTSVDAPTASLFNLAALPPFFILAFAAIGYRRRPNIHKRLMLWANITLMTAPIAHLLGHVPSTWLSPAAANAAGLILTILFLLAPFAGDYVIEKRIRFLTVSMAIGFIALQQLVIFVIAPSAAWHRFAEWMSQ